MVVSDVYLIHSQSCRLYVVSGEIIYVSISKNQINFIKRLVLRLERQL